VGSKEDVYGATSEEETILDLKHDLVNHLVLSKKGRRLKSSTFLLKGEDYHYALGVNFDFTDLYQAVKIQEDLIAVKSDLEKAVTEENQGNLKEIFDSCLQIVGKPASALSKSERLRLVSLLKERKAFEFYKAVPYISQQMGVTRSTVYNYLNQLEP
ncbi:MAG: helix-turn-helix domain-containing protein, partial [Blautia sp.]